MSKSNGETELSQIAAILSSLQKKRSEDGRGRFDELRYAKKLQTKLPPIRTVGPDWFAYRQGCWNPAEKDEFRPISQQVCPPRYRTASNEKRLLDHIEGMSQQRRKEFMGLYYFDESNGDVLINVKNGIVRVKAKGEIKLEKHKPEFLFTAQTEAAFDPKADCSTFERVMKEALPDVDDQTLLQAFCANVLLPSSCMEAALIAYGETGTSKSTVAEAVASALGEKCVTSLSMQAICDSRSYALPKLEHAALNLGTEVDTIEMDESTNFKLIVSGEPVMARPIYGKPREIRTVCKLWFVSNTLPRFKHGTEAELRRVRFLRFDNKVAKKEFHLKERLRTEKDGVLYWMLQGLVCLLNMQEIPLGGEKSRKVHDQFAISNDPIGCFVQKKCEMDKEAWVAKDVMAEAYNDFLKDHGMPHEIEKWFFRRLYERFSNISDFQRQIDGSRKRYLRGIRLLSE